MTSLLLALAAANSPASVEAEGARVRVSIRASVYLYEVTNTGHEALVRFEVPFADGYYFQVPDGWKSSHDGGVFRAWAADPFDAIRPGRSAEFSFRVTSRGAVLGPVDARVESLSGATVTLKNVWGSSPEPRSYALLVAGVVLALCGGHVWWLARAERRRAGRTTGP